MPPLGAFDNLLAVFWTFKSELLSSIGSKWAPKGLLDGFGVALGGFWGGLGKVYKENLEDFGPFEKSGQILKMLNMISPC